MAGVERKVFGAVSMWIFGRIKAPVWGRSTQARSFTTCDYTRANCTARGMFTLGRFGGVEFVPAADSSTWVWTTLVSIFRGEPGTRRFTTTLSRWYMGRPGISRLSYSRAMTETSRTWKCCWGWGRSTDVVKVVVSDIEIPEGVSGANMTATGWYNVITRGAR